MIFIYNIYNIFLSYANIGNNKGYIAYKYNPVLQRLSPVTNLLYDGFQEQPPPLMTFNVVMINAIKMFD